MFNEINEIEKQARAAILEVYRYSCVGSGLHIVLDDENIEDFHIEECLAESIPEIADEKERRACERCAKLLLQIPVKQREKIVHGYGREYW